MSTPRKITLTVNGKRHNVEAYPMARLLDTLREPLRLTGTKEGCGEGECGACAILLDGELVNSCLIPTAQADGARITTIEGVEGDGRLHPIQECFIEEGGTQCGICTPGMVLAAQALLRRNKKPNEAAIREGLAGNLCRCTGYTRIFAAVKAAAKGRAKQRASTPKKARRGRGR